MQIVAYKYKSFWQKVYFYPLSLLHGLILWIRHFLFDQKVIPSTRFHFPVIVVGNIAIGGTGKTPFTAYLCELLQSDYIIAMISRGYKRRTSGYHEVSVDSIHADVGDEPSWLKKQFPNISVCVCEDRVLALSYLLQDKPFLDAVIFDDAFQHRKLDSAMNIVLTDYTNMFYEDRLFPLGRLRDIPQAMKRASIIVVTKCPLHLSSAEKKHVEEKLSLQKNQKVFFSGIHYRKPYPIVEGNYIFTHFKNHHVLLITGIANPTPLIKYLDHQKAKVNHQSFADHFDFTYEDIINMIAVYDALPNPKMILCTEKDAVKLQRFSKYWKHLPVFVIPIKTSILEEEQAFLAEVKKYIDSY